MRRPRFPLGLLIGVFAVVGLAGCPAASRPDAPADATHPVEFSLGPNRFVLPANWFADGTGPDFQGGVTLALHWPSLEPYPPGQPYSSFTTGPMRNQRVLVTIDYIDRVPIDELPERYVTLRPGEDPNDPSNNLALRDRLPDRYGLEHYVVNVDLLHAWVNRFPGNTPLPKERLMETGDDWLIARDADGRIRTVIRCDNGRRPDGEAIEGEALVEVPGSSRSPQCGSHRFSMPEYSISVRAGYSRPLIRDWRRIESAVRNALARAHDGANPSPRNGATRP